MALDLWAAGGQLGSTLAAAIFCWIAWYRSTGADRAAWRNFAIGATIYLSGNLTYLFLDLGGIVPAFPTPAEAAYFAMALFFAAGMFQYARLRHRIDAVQIYNFVLIYCAITLSILFFLNRSIETSVLPPFATIVAFIYPALWLSVGASGLISLLLRERGRHAFPFLLMVVAVFAESIADFRYALGLMDGSYLLGGLTQWLWVTSAALIVWAAIEQVAIARRPDAATDRTERRGPERGVTQALLPAAATAMVVLSGSLTGAVGGGPYIVLAVAVALVFTLAAALREYWIILLQRRLRAAVETSRADLAISQARMTSVLESTSDAVLVLDREWTIVYFNHRAMENVNFTDRLKIGNTIWNLFPAAQTSGEGAHYRRALATGQPAEFEIFVEDRHAWLDIRAYPTQDGLSIFFRDVSERKRDRDQVTHLAHHDALTGLANRALFQTRLSEALAGEATCAVLLIDLDHFKEVNDSLGHPAGDALLKSAAERLLATLPDGATVARLGGDEFAAIVATGHDGAEALARKVLVAIAAPHRIDGQSIPAGASIGVALKGDAATTPEQILKHADIALYTAKSEARGTFRLFETAMDSGLKQRQALRIDLRVALERGEFVLAYQPLLDLHTDRVANFEALLRWHHPDKGVVPPDVFIPLAEETGLMADIGAWVLRTACAEATKWPRGVSVSVNLSSRQFANGNLTATVEDALAMSGLRAQRLELEITESVLLRDSEANLSTLRQLREMGVRIALDDFGTGFSSLAYLQRFPFSKIKIDRGFVSGLPASLESQAIVRSVIGLGQALGMRVTAEGVETSAQFDWVRAGCDEAQGYLISRPVPASEVPALIARFGGRNWQNARLAS